MFIGFVVRGGFDLRGGLSGHVRGLGVLPSVVTISATGAGTGSGEVIRSDGYILTNNQTFG